jgi:DNA ligase-1
VPRFPSYVGVHTEAGRPAAPAPAAPAKVAAPGKGAAATKRYFELVEGKSSKFWEVSVSGKDVTTRWGRTGGDGRAQTKTFVDEAAARAEADRLIAEKTEKGYVEK